MSSETMSEAKKGELAIRDKAILHQQRRLKQATQFTHKDSADLLPLDGLKRLGTSKDLVSADTLLNDRVCAAQLLRKVGSMSDGTKAGFNSDFWIIQILSKAFPPIPTMHPGSLTEIIAVLGCWDTDVCLNPQTQRFYLSKVSVK